MGKRLKPVCLVQQPDLPMQCQIWESSVCNTGKQEQLSCILHNPTRETVPTASSRAGELVEFIITCSCYFGVFQGIFVDLLVMWTYHTQFPVSSEFCMWRAFKQYQLRLVIKNIQHCVGWNSVKAVLISGHCLWEGGAFPWKPIYLFTSSNT